MNTLKAYNPTADLDTLSRLVVEFKLMHNPLDHATVREERACQRCRLLKQSQQALADLKAHRETLNEHLEAVFG